VARLGGPPKLATDCAPTGVRDPHALDLERRVVRSERLRHHRCEAGERKHCQRLARETMTELKHVLGGAARTAGEQLERLAPIWAEVRFLR